MAGEPSQRLDKVELLLRSTGKLTVGKGEVVTSVTSETRKARMVVPKFV